MENLRHSSNRLLGLFMIRFLIFSLNVKYVLVVTTNGVALMALISFALKYYLLFALIPFTWKIFFSSIHVIHVLSHKKFKCLLILKCSLELLSFGSLENMSPEYYILQS